MVFQASSPPTISFHCSGRNINRNPRLLAHLCRINADNDRFRRPINKHLAHRQHKSPKRTPSFRTWIVGAETAEQIPADTHCTFGQVNSNE